ncbi:MAG: YkgJ family cysteine cluster protein [Euryarchaeota archaeon]|nr:YkgJ family cysteine cluster protein [Euryarchaeota archaeon]
MNSNRRNMRTKALQELINTTIQDFSDCSLCTFCCIEGVINLYEADILKISKYLKINPKSLVEHYTKYNLKTGEIKIDLPCSFLKKNQCIIYPVRPEVCRNYPLFVENNDTVHVYAIETCATATLFFEAYTDFLETYHPDCYRILQKNLDKEKPLKNNDMINMQFSKEHLELFIKWLNASKKERKATKNVLKKQDHQK